jgi:hypothetical protein
VDGQIHSNVKLPVNGNLDHHETTTLQHWFFFVRKDPMEIVDHYQSSKAARHPFH